MFVATVICWHLAHVSSHKVSGYAAVGVLAVGLIHARLWRNNAWPWRKSPVEQWNLFSPPP